MKKFLAILLGALLLLLVAACTNDSGQEEADGEEKEETEASASPDMEAEIDMETLLDQIEMDAAVNASGDAATFEFSLKNTGEDPVILGFTSGQKYEVEVKNVSGETVYKYSDGQMFTQALTTEELAGGGTYQAEDTWKGIEQPGKYEVTMTILVHTINDQSLEANPFQVTQEFTVQPDKKESDQDQASTEEETPSEETEEAAPPVEDSYSGDGETFRSLTVSGDNGSYVVKGEANVSNGTFIYTVEDGHNVQVEPSEKQVGASSSWTPFEISVTIPEDKLPDFGTITLTMFTENGDGLPENLNYIPLDRF
ncbi:hypothetical protein M662_05760 [Bacillus sp. SB49]|uniref:BsuPI-related putative proteinase inhibitor n=1 Tax=Bacillus sp. SB49 TaxID=1071080 RepID=UPI000416BF58|nr:BsuPI-related putative proteinase inhibitor [Bacillus sp. SB49]QHT46017.1 hypothetical protein M662_05760 [Bacillus sp. SB49]